MEISIEMKKLMEKFDLLLITFENRKSLKNGRYKEIAEELKKELCHVAFMEGVLKGIIDFNDKNIARLEERCQGKERRKAVKNAPSRQQKEMAREKFPVINGGLYISTVPKGRDDGLTDEFRTWIHEEKMKPDHHTDA